MRSIILILLFAIPIALFAQKPRVLEPIIGPTPDLSPEFIARFNSAEAFRECNALMERISKERRDYTQSTEAEKAVFKYCDETRENATDVRFGGCSWYCNGWADTIVASSALAPQAGITYDAGNAHDNSYMTAWVEGADGYGVGESITYTFSGRTPRITKVSVVNGYVKTETAWKNNSRVRQLLLYYNDTPIGILNLKDVPAHQEFTLEYPLGHSNRDDYEALKKMPNWTMRFEILSVYPGDRYADTAITQIYFDGIDVH